MGNFFGLCISRPQSNQSTQDVQTDSINLLKETISESISETKCDPNDHKVHRIYTIQSDFNSSNNDRAVEKDLEKRFGF